MSDEKCKVELDQHMKSRNLQKDFPIQEGVLYY